ncbi:PKD domain-containing protein [Flavobacterium filum]|uniref:PKD domain-containing protein n=1 Tax=Flavobacterium filum TaxID=370974 RepID=UPI00042874BE|nr:PKD domain-containing protein [Flavobacterium filum]
MKIKLHLVGLSFLGCFSVVCGQNSTKRTLFLGNSYTATNNLPQMIDNVANSTGDDLIYDSYTPGGYTFMGHSTNATSLNKIAQGTWDFVVLQEQSQLPSFPDSQVQNQVYPYAQQLNNLINQQNPCAETVFYMTWGRKNGDASNCANWPPVCTYTGMDDLLNERYRFMAEQNDAILSPVGAVWRYIRENYPSIELYSADGSHPSVAGTYAAACSFYATLFRKNPEQITFTAGLTNEVATAIRSAAKVIVFDQLLEWQIGEYDPMANFVIEELGDGQFSLTNTSENATSYLWNFGDGTTSTEANPSHTYTATGEFTIELTVESCGKTATYAQTVIVTTLSLGEVNHPKKAIQIYPNPTHDFITIESPDEYIGKSFYLIDITGRMVMNANLNALKTFHDLSHLTDGVYFLKVNDSSNSTVKIVKK